MLFQYGSVWFTSCYSTTLQRGRTKESFLMNRAFILLVSAPLVYLLSVAARAESLCSALSWALHMDIQRQFFSSQDLTLTRSPLCSGAILLTFVCFPYIGFKLWFPLRILAMTCLAELVAENAWCYHCCGAYQFIGSMAVLFKVR